MTPNCEGCVHYTMCDALDRGGDLKFCDPAKCRLYSPEPKTRTIEIPCDVGTTVWFIRNKEIIQTVVEKIVLKDNGLYLKLACNAMYETSCRSIGKTVFFTKEAAEKALE